LGVDAAQILEAEEAAAMMGLLNSYYKFRGFISKAEPQLVTDNYNQAGLRMTALARPAMGRENFELLALAVSVVNGCETCVTSHERVLRESGVLPTKIHDAVRLAASIKGLSQLEGA
jgi:alkyl hydroperoxide reductase subunit D